MRAGERIIEFLAYATDVLDSQSLIHTTHRTGNLRETDERIM